MTAYDLNTGTIRWHRPVGGVSELEKDGHANTGARAPRGGLLASNAESAQQNQEAAKSQGLQNAPALIDSDRRDIEADRLHVSVAAYIQPIRDRRQEVRGLRDYFW